MKSQITSSRGLSMSSFTLWSREILVCIRWYHYYSPLWSRLVHLKRYQTTRILFPSSIKFLNVEAPWEDLGRCLSSHISTRYSQVPGCSTTPQTATMFYNMWIIAGLTRVSQPAYTFLKIPGIHRPKVEPVLSRRFNIIAKMTTTAREKYHTIVIKRDDYQQQ